MYIAKAAAVFAAALFCLASPATANGTTNQTLAGKNSLANKLKSNGVATGGNWVKGQIFSFYIDYGDVPGPSPDTLERYYPQPPNTSNNFRAAFYEKRIFADAAKATLIGNALYNIQIFDQSATLAEGNYQSVQNIPLKGKKGKVHDVYININGRIEYTLNGANPYPIGVTRAKILSIAVSSLEADGISCVNVGVSPIRADPSDPTSITEYIIDTRKAVCVNQAISG